MKKLLVFSIAIFCYIQAFPQAAKKPIIMVVPSDAWCDKNGFMMEFDNQGKKVKVPDYKKALQENTDLLLVIAKINELMTERGFPLQNLETILKDLETQSAQDAMGSTKSGDISESPVDKLKKVAKADLIIQVTWSVNPVGPKKSITFILQGLDSYTNKQKAGASGTGQPSFTAELPVLLEEAVLAHLDNFNNQLMNHFQDMFDNGREVTLRVKKFDVFEGDLETEYEGKELGALIEDWVSQNTVAGKFNTTDATENILVIKEVRISLFDASGKATSTRDWARGLQKYLRDKLQIESKLSTLGLGEAQITVGGK